MKAHPKTGRTIREEAEFLVDNYAQDQLFESDHPKSFVTAIERAILRYAAPRYAKNGTSKAKDAPDPRIAEFLTWFCDEYNIKSSGAEYLVKNGQDHALVKALLKVTTLDVLKDCATILLDLRTADKFIQESDRGIGILSVKFNWLNQRRAAFLAKQRAR